MYALHMSICIVAVWQACCEICSSYFKMHLMVALYPSLLGGGA